jgi:hypothetical protein
MVIWKPGNYGYYGAYLNGEKLNIPSVTTIVSMLPDPELDAWIEAVGVEQAEIIKTRAANRGTSMHIYLENYFDNFSKTRDHNKSLLHTQKKSLHFLRDIEKIPEAELKLGRSLFYKIIEEFKNIDEVSYVIGLESKIFHPLAAYRGAYDINYLKDVNGDYQNVITDYKTSSKRVQKGSVKEQKYLLQLAAYWMAYEHLKKTELNQAKLWIAIKDGDTQEIKIGKEEARKHYKTFSKLCNEYHTKHNQNTKLFEKYTIR